MANIRLLNPLGSQLPSHENRLTWAFLVVLRYDPLLQNFLRRFVEKELPERGRDHSSLWNLARVSSQTKWIDSSTSRLVSVLLTDKTLENIRVEWSDRDAIYDGVIEYSDGLTFIVENKLSHENVRQGQLCPSRRSVSGQIDDIELYQFAVCLEWSEIMEGVLNYTDSGIASYSSYEISQDLLSFVEEHHPDLTPYRTFKLCGNRPKALERRSTRLVDALANRAKLENREGWYLFRPNKIAERIGLWFESNSVLTVNLWPADTVSQARRFFEKVDRARFLGLDQVDWQIKPNLHFSYMNRHLFRTRTTWVSDKYFDYFQGGNSYGKMNDESLIPLAEQWEDHGLITHDDRMKIQDQFDSTRRETLNVIPGFSLSRVWDLNTLSELEENDELEEQILDSLRAPLDCWGEEI